MEKDVRGQKQPIIRTSFIKYGTSLFKSVRREEVREMNGSPILLQFKFSSLISGQMQNYLEYTLPFSPFFFTQMLLYSY